MRDIGGGFGIGLVLVAIFAAIAAATGLV